MPAPQRLIRAAVGLPVAVARRAAGIAGGLLPGRGRTEPEPEVPDVEAAAEEAVARERDPVEEAPVADDSLGGHVDPEVELVTESTDPEATEPPGPDVHVDDRR